MNQSAPYEKKEVDGRSNFSEFSILQATRSLDMEKFEEAKRWPDPCFLEKISWKPPVTAVDICMCIYIYAHRLFITYDRYVHNIYIYTHTYIYIGCKYTSLWFCEQIVMWSPKVAHSSSQWAKDPFSKGSEDDRVSGIGIVYIGGAGFSFLMDQ